MGFDYKRFTVMFHRCGRGPLHCMSIEHIFLFWSCIRIKKRGKRKVQGVPQSQTAALSRHQEEKEPTKPNKNKSNKRTKNTKISSLFPKRGNRNAKRTEKHKNKITQGKT